MEDENITGKNPKPTIIKAPVKHSSTYSSGNVNGLGKIKRKKVVFVDRAQNIPLCTVFNYEQVDLIEDEYSPKSSSCACVVF